MTAPRVTVNLTGVKDLVEALRSLPERMEKAVLRSALRKAAKPILTGAKLRAPVQTGVLRDSLKIKSAKRNKANKHRVTFTVGTGASAEQFSGKAFYGGWQELGWLSGKRTTSQREAQKTIIRTRKEITALRKTGKGIDVTEHRIAIARNIVKQRKEQRLAKATNEHGRKKVPGLHYVQRSFNENAERSKDGLEQDIRDGLLKEAEKAAKKLQSTVESE